MLGPARTRRLREPIAVSLEALVPGDHFSRRLETKRDLSFVRDLTRQPYAERGRPSIDPVVFIKLQLVMVFEGIRSERQLIATASLNLAHRWRLGYALDEPLPDHSSLTRIRQRLGIAIFERFFEQIVTSARRRDSSGARSSISTAPRSRPTPTSTRSSHASSTRRNATSATCSPRRCQRTTLLLHLICPRGSCHCRSSRTSLDHRRPMSVPGDSWMSGAWIPTGHPIGTTTG